MASDRPVPEASAPKHKREHGARPARHPLSGLVVELLRPCHGWLAIVLIAMLTEIAMSIAAP